MKTRATSIKVKSGIKAGKLATNHNVLALKVRTGIKAGKLAVNHNTALLTIG